MAASLGLACFFSWSYTTLFGCGLVTHSFMKWGLESIWLVTGAAEAATAIFLAFVLIRKRFRPNAFICTTAGVLAVLGNIAIWIGYYDNSLFPLMRLIAGVCTGIATLLFMLVWGRVLSRYDMEHIEFMVPFAFVITFATYWLLLVTKVSSVPVLIIDSIFPLISMALAKRASHVEPSRDAVQALCKPLSFDRTFRESLSLFALIAVMWIQIAYFRALATPDIIGDRFWHYLVPFSTSCLIAVVAFVAFLKMSRLANFTIMIRCALPLFMFSYGLLSFDYDDPSVRIASYTINFVGMFAVQLCCWVAAPKHVQRSNVSSDAMFLGFAIAQGAGIFFGTAACIRTATSVSQDTLMAISLIIMATVLCAAMILGFNPRWILNRDTRGPCPSDEVEARQRAAHGAERQAAGAENLLEKDRGPGRENPFDKLQFLMEQQARALQSRYDLTERETEITAYLIAGRSRPYIRDELVISLNTVHAHARNIFSKCNVHSQQELMDLAQSSGQGELP